MAIFPPEDELSSQLDKHLRRIHQGKVRDTYELPDHLKHLLVVATDRISVYDFVLPAKVARKGEVLTALSIFWFTQVLKGTDDHLIAFGAGVNRFVPSALRNNKQLHQRAIVVRQANMLPVEAVVRGYLTGSGWRSYQKSGEVCGIALPPGLHDGARLPEPIFTPTTKAKVGHDMPLNTVEVVAQWPWIEDRAISAYKQAAQYALEQGVIIADTKLEFGANQMLCDEVFTPDSSRFWDVDEYQAAKEKGTSPTGYDKEPVRQAATRAVIRGREVNISKLDPTNPVDEDLVSMWQVPTEDIRQTTERYLTIAQRLLEMDLDSFQADEMLV